MPENDIPPSATRDYEAKTSHEAARLARRVARAGTPQPFGDPLSGIVLVAKPTGGPADARMVDALRRSLAAVKLDRAYVAWSHPNLLEEILSLEPIALVPLGPAAAHAIDSCNYPLAKAPFSEAHEGSWFAWTKGTHGLRLPDLAPALADTAAKRRFWEAFLALRTLATGR
ncbi:MAG: hypothetical protein AVDCRST_MAG78-1286 [uncultured Rubrobacteraceae bacterium]|uniref:Uncharacterized protein n=1 Tax=uncultured Rubrobacteraceae bacterium TaxID=349277 RepID=A0A6J4Q0L4_9ACTN|nr:MAG: hypothetical protein AVDCRST_MAG78-1286 [uncultured Rubrobacteraceae bacterium]